MWCALRGCVEMRSERVYIERIERRYTASELSACESTIVKYCLFC